MRISSDRSPTWRGRAHPAAHISGDLSVRATFGPVSVALGRRIRWTAVVLLVAAWFVALAVDVGGNGVHLLLAAAVAVLFYDLVTVDTPA